MFEEDVGSGGRMRNEDKCRSRSKTKGRRESQ